jgi:hypothetical protein
MSLNLPATPPVTVHAGPSAEALAAAHLAAEREAAQARLEVQIAEEDELLLRGMIGGPGKLLYRIKTFPN